jgi:ABC-type polysaccharide/polyol phosphate export permease
MFPSLIALIVMLVSLMFAQTVVMMERKSSAYFRNLVTPTKEQVFILSNFLTTLLLLVLQLLLILGISMIVFKVDILANFLPTLLALLIIATFFIIVGITVGTVFSSPETSTLGAISIGSICLFLSDVLLPLETMPGYIQNIAQFNPFVVAEHLLRSTIIFKVGLVAVFTEQYAQFKLPAIFIMLAYAIFMAIILLVSNEMIKRAAIQRKTMPKKAKKGAVDMEKAELGADPIERIETLIKTATDMIKGKEYVKANLVYVHLNEMYTNLPPEKKKEYFKKIEQIHQQLRKADQPKQ